MKRSLLENPATAIAAVISTDSGEGDPAVVAAVEALRRRGVRVRGLLQERETGDGCSGMSLIDIERGTRYPITQNLCSGSKSCALDTGLVAAASAVMHDIAASGADLAVFNRFGALEATGGGFHAEMLAIMAAGIPVLAIVPDKQLGAWQHFTGWQSAELAADTAQILAWFDKTGRR